MSKILKNDTDTSGFEDEQKTIRVMIELFCRDHHAGRSGAPLCDSCRELLNYSIERVKCCPVKETRTTCGQCQVHCYKPTMQKRIKEVMRYSGPRMFKEHPLLAAKHLLKGMVKK